MRDLHRAILRQDPALDAPAGQARRLRRPPRPSSVVSRRSPSSSRAWTMRSRAEGSSSCWPASPGSARAASRRSWPCRHGCAARESSSAAAGRAQAELPRTGRGCNRFGRMSRRSARCATGAARRRRGRPGSDAPGAPATRSRPAGAARRRGRGRSRSPLRRHGPLPAKRLAGAAARARAGRPARRRRPSLLLLRFIGRELSGSRLVVGAYRNVDPACVIRWSRRSVSSAGSR